MDCKENETQRLEACPRHEVRSAKFTTSSSEMSVLTNREGQISQTKIFEYWQSWFRYHPMHLTPSLSLWLLCVIRTWPAHGCWNAYGNRWVQLTGVTIVYSIWFQFGTLEEAVNKEFVRQFRSKLLHRNLAESARSKYRQEFANRWCLREKFERFNDRFVR